MKDFSIISALDENRGIGKSNGLAWHLAADLKHFAETTKGGTVIMGRKTWESLPERYRPLPGRKNIVVSRGDIKLPGDVFLVHSLDEALVCAEEKVPRLKVFIIGGATLYAEAIQHTACEELLLTEIEGVFDCDAFFPEIPSNFKKSEESELQEENSIRFRFVTYRK